MSNHRTEEWKGRFLLEGDSYLDELAAFCACEIHISLLDGHMEITIPHPAGESSVSMGMTPDGTLYLNLASPGQSPTDDGNEWELRSGKWEQTL